jgi:hypothetical protein
MKVFFSMLQGLFSPQRTQSIAAMVFANSLGYKKIINNELVQTPYELTLPEFVSVSFSSVFENHREHRVHREKRQPLRSLCTLWLIAYAILTEDGSMEVDHETL